MRVKLLKDTRVLVKAGATVDVTPETARFLVAVGSAAATEKEKPKQKEE